MLSLDVAYAVFKELLKEERTIHAGEAFGMYAQDRTCTSLIRPLFPNPNTNSQVWTLPAHLPPQHYLSLAINYYPLSSLYA